MSIAPELKIAVVALSLGLDVFAVCIGVGMRGLQSGMKVRIGAAFATAEVAMTLCGVLVGATAGKILGDIAGYIGFAALCVVGIYMLAETLRAEHEAGFDLSRGWGLVLASLSISVDSLGIGFSILFIGVPLSVSLACIALASVTATTLGLTLGKMLGARMEAAAALWAAGILIATGLTLAGLKYFRLA